MAEKWIPSGHDVLDWPSFNQDDAVASDWSQFDSVPNGLNENVVEKPKTSTDEYEVPPTRPEDN